VATPTEQSKLRRGWGTAGDKDGRGRPPPAPGDAARSASRTVAGVTSLGIVFRPQANPERLRETARTAEHSGLDELWLWEDCFDHGGIATAAAALASTDRLRVGIGVLPVALRNIAITAMEIASLERMFPGRVMPGVGHGVLEWMAQVGEQAASPMTLLREYTAALQALLAGDTVTVRGEYVRLDGVQLGWPPEHPPRLQVAAIRPRTLALAGELGDGVVLTSDTLPEELAEARRVVASSRGSGRDPARVTVYVAVEPAAGPPAAAALARSYSAAGADAVVLQPPGDADPAAFARFVGDEVRQLL
jgi:alkanesulfonate monooxygenase SsuD/methylene tetrahydromethanopterin reductase-like flavin-dependent oxidoreductase (luciferase family)